MDVIQELSQHASTLNGLMSKPDTNNEFWREAVLEEWCALKDLHDTHSYLVDDPSAPRAGDWLAVISDSHCTVKLGGPGHLWQLEGPNPYYRDCWILKGVGSTYPKSMFRRAHPSEIIKHHLTNPYAP